MQSIKEQGLAGDFYPDTSKALKETLQKYINAVPIVEGLGLPKLIIVPHSKYKLSGEIAAYGYKYLEFDTSHKISKVIIIGPSHKFKIKGVLASGYDYFRTPLGLVPVDSNSRIVIRQNPYVQVTDTPFEREHSIESQLPFLQYMLSKNSFTITPLLASDATHGMISSILSMLWGRDDTLLVVSLDLSHYHSVDVANKIDEATLNAIVNLDQNGIKDDSCCGISLLQGVISLAKQKNLTPTILSSSNSSRNDKLDGVVGFAAVHMK